MPSASQTHELAPHASIALAASAGVSPAAAGWDISVATSGIGGSGEDGAPLLGGAVLIAGPTASGKSALALDVARQIDGIVVNTDSMQVYAGLAVLTAQPSDEDLAAAPHSLYGHVDPAEPYSTGAWLRDVAALADANRGQRLVFVGGTGLYFEALTGGLAEIPQPDPTVRALWRERLAVEGPRPLHDALAVRDPQSAARLSASDGHRIVRALEVVESTGRTIGAWREQRGRALVDTATAVHILLDIDRAALAQRIDARFDLMLEQGAIAEVEGVLARNLPVNAPAMKAIGVPELAAALRGDISEADAVALAKTRTRQYAKRQVTWFRNRFGPEWRRVLSAEAIEKIDLPLQG